MCDITSAELEAAVRALVTAQQTTLGIELTLPVMYANGEAVSVVVSHEGSLCVVHDAGFAAMHLASLGAKLTKNMQQRLRDLAGRFGCNFDRNRVFRHCSKEQVPLVCAVVANASRLIGDQALELKRFTENEFKAMLLELLREIVGDRLRQNEMVRGQSGRTYKVDSIILDNDGKQPKAFVLGIANKAVTSSSFAELFDIRQAHRAVANEAIYDETSDIRDEDLRLLGEVSDLFPYADARHRLMRLVA